MITKVFPSASVIGHTSRGSVCSRREGMCTQTYVHDYQIMSADHCAPSALKAMSIFSLHLVMKIKEKKKKVTAVPDPIPRVIIGS